MDAVEAARAGEEAARDLQRQREREALDDEEELPPDGPSVDELTLTVTWGEETFQPVQFHGFRVGPLTATAKVSEGQSIAAVYRELWLELDALGRAQFKEKLAGMLDRIKQCGKAAFDAREQGR